MEEAKATAVKVFRLSGKYHSENATIIRSYGYIVLAVAARVNEEFQEAEVHLEKAYQVKIQLNLLFFFVYTSRVLVRSMGSFDLHYAVYIANGKKK